MLSNKIILFMCLFFIGQVLSSQYIYSFTGSYTMFTIDVETGLMPINQSLSMGYSPNLILSASGSTLTMMANYLEFEGTEYVIIDYNFEQNLFSNIGPNISIGDKYITSNLIQKIQSVGANYYLPITILNSTNTDLTILDWDFKTPLNSILYFAAEDYNLNTSPVATYNDVTNRYYVLYFGLTNIPYIKSFPTPLVSGQTKGIETFNFNNGIIYNENIGQLFSTQFSSSVYYIENYPTNITICELNFSTLKCDNVFSFALIYSPLFTPYFFSQDNQYLIVMQSATPDKSSPVTYTFIDLVKFTIVHSFTSPNYYTTTADDMDTFFYFDGSF